MHPYEPRPIRFHGLRTQAGWRVKLYTIVIGDSTLEWPAFEPAVELALGALPTPAVTAERPGAGYLILHQGRGMNYAVLGWWDCENEMPVRVFVARPEEGGVWRLARGSESFCVWDLQVIWFEREAYVDTVMAPSGGGGVDEYLSRALALPGVPAAAESV